MPKNDRTSLFIELDPELQEILDNFSSLFNIRIAYFRPDGSEYSIGRSKNISDYCRLIREQLSYTEKCLSLDLAMRLRAKKERCIQSYTCHGGCIEVIKPIFIEDELLGFIMIGQALTQRRIPTHVIDKAAQAGVTDELHSTFHSLPFYSEMKMNNIIKLFSELTDLIILKKLVKRKEQGVVKVIAEYMKNVNSRLSLGQAAEIAKISESRLRHKFREEMGIPFSQYRNMICMSRAKELLSNNKEMPIQMVAYNLGYSDPLYFSRAFKKFYGHPPSWFR